MRWPSRTETIGRNSGIGRCRILFVVVSCSFAAMLGDHVLAAWIRFRRSLGSRALSSLSLDVPSQMLRRFQLAFHERLVDDHLYGDIGEFFLLPTFYLLAHRLKVPLHPVHTNRDAIDERKRLRVLRQHRRTPRQWPRMTDGQTGSNRGVAF